MTRYMALVLIALCSLGALAGAYAQQQPTAQQDTNVLTLQDAMRLALERNPSITSAQWDVRSRRAALAGQRARWLPTLEASVEGRIQQSLARPVNVGGGTITTTGGRVSETSDVALTLGQVFYQSGLQEAIDAAGEQVAVSRAGLEGARQQLLLRVAATFYAVLADRELVQVAEEAVRAAQLHLELVDARIEAGTAAPADRLPVEAELADARYQSVSAVNAVWQTLAELQALLALPADELPLVRGELVAMPEVDELPVWIEQALARRPDLIAQRHQVRVAELSLRQAQIDAGLSVQVIGQADYGRHTGTEGESWWVAAGVSYPLHNGPARAAVDQAHANLEMARQRLAELELTVTREVSQAWYALQDAGERVAAAQAALAAAASNLEAARERYREGVGTIVEVTDAELNWRRAGVQLVQSRYDRSVAYYQLLAAGGVLQGPEASAEEPAPQADEAGTVVEQ